MLNFMKMSCAVQHKVNIKSYRLYNAAARLIARLHRTFHITAFMFDHLHWLPLIARIQLKVLTLICRSKIGQVASKYLRGLYARLFDMISFSMREDFYGSDTSLCNHWPCALEPTLSFDPIHLINW